MCQDTPHGAAEHLMLSDKFIRVLISTPFLTVKCCLATILHRFLIMCKRGFYFSYFILPIGIIVPLASSGCICLTTKSLQNLTDSMQKNIRIKILRITGTGAKGHL